MSRDEYREIKDRAAISLWSSVPGEPALLIVCGNAISGQIIDPNELGDEAAAKVKVRAKALGEAVRDRQVLIDFINESLNY